jgi:hypothetical protein
MKLPLLALVEEREERARLTAPGSAQSFDIFKKNLRR